MKVSEVKVSKAGNDQLFVPLSKKLTHNLKAGDRVEVSVRGNRIIVEKIQ